MEPGPSASLHSRSKLELLILQPTPFCNLNCDYCYLPDRANVAVMSDAVLAKAIERVFQSKIVGHQFTVVWHAGEPLVVSPSFYDRAVTIIDRANFKGCAVSHSLQTNGTLINSAWCELFRRHEFRVGVSIDGPRFLHDRHRRRRSGRGTYDEVMHGISMLKQHGIKFQVIAVITRDTLEHADEVFSFFAELGAERVGFNIEEAEGPNESSSIGGEDEESLRAFVRTLFNRWVEHPSAPRIREFEGLLSSVKHWRPDDPVGPLRQEARPFSIVSVDVNGDFATFSPELLGASMPFGKFAFGNVLRDTIDGCWENPNFMSVLNEINTGIDRCRATCEYFSLCGGGTPSNKYFEHGSFACTETRHCVNSRKIIVDESFDILEGRLTL